MLKALVPIHVFTHEALQATIMVDLRPCSVYRVGLVELEQKFWNRSHRRIKTRELNPCVRAAVQRLSHTHTMHCTTQHNKNGMRILFGVYADGRRATT